MATFLEIATPLIQRGIPVIPVQPNAKRCLLREWQIKATTDVNVVRQWNQENPQFNVGCVGKPDGFVMLDCDVVGLREHIEKETGQKFPRTLIVKSAGKGAEHIYFRQTDRTRGLGNRSSAALFDLQSVDKYVVGAGSSLANGKTYEVVDESSIAEFPDWLAGWIERHSDAAKEHRGGKGAPVHEDFDFDRFCDHFDFTFVGDNDGKHFFEACPYKGDRHTSDGKPDYPACAIFYDGATIGFSDLATSCEGNGKTIGDLIRHRYEQGCEKYDGEIFAEEEAIGELLEEFEAVEADDEDDPMDVLFAEQAKRINPDPLPVPEIVATKVEEGTLEFPGESAMYGKLKAIALGIKKQYPDIQLGWLYPSLLGIASMLPIEDMDGHVKPNLYVANLGESRYGKSIHLDLAERAIFVPETTTCSVSPVSDRGLANLMSEDDASQRVGLVADELKILMSKCAIENSALAPMLCTLWSKRQSGFSDKRSAIKCFGVLSIVGNLAVSDPSEFASVFGKETTKGLAHRFVFGYSCRRVNYRPVTIKAEIFGDLKPVTFPAWVWQARDEWAKEDSALLNVSENMLRIALISAAVTGEREITKECLEAAMRFAEWQARLKEVFRPGVAETKDAEAYDAIYLALWEQRSKQLAAGEGPEGNPPDWIDYRKVCNSKSYYRKYGKLVSQVKKDMAESGILEEIREVEHDSNGHEKKRKKTKFVRLRAKLK